MQCGDKLHFIALVHLTVKLHFCPGAVEISQLYHLSYRRERGPSVEFRMDTETLAQPRISYPASMDQMEHFEFYHASGFRFHVYIGHLIHVASAGNSKIRIKFKIDCIKLKKIPSQTLKSVHPAVA